MSTWDEIDEQYSNDKQYKDYAPEGEFTTKVESCGMAKSRVKSTPGLEFKLQDNDEYAFPKYGTTHYSFTTDNINWRKKHNRDLMIVLGAKKEAAEKAVDVCEGKGDSDAIVKAYEDAFKRLVSKHPEVKVAVFKRRSDDKYSTWDFAEYSVRMGRPEDGGKTPSEETDIFAGAEEAKIEDTDESLPF